MYSFKFVNRKGFKWWIRGKSFAKIKSKLEEMGISSENGWTEIGV